MRRLARPTIALVFGFPIALAAGLAAQEPRVLIGRVMAGMTSVPNQPVSLHRVTASGGNTLSTDTTDADGRFELALDAATNAEGVQFVATRYEGKLYIGDTFRNDPPAGYALRVGPGATPIELGTTNPGTVAAVPARPARNSAGLVVLAVASLVLGAVFFFAARQRGGSGRQLLLEIADLDNRHETAAQPRYEPERADLLRRLRESA